MATPLRSSDPALPTFVKVVTTLDIVFSLARLGGGVLILQLLAFETNPTDRQLSLLSLAVNTFAAVFGLLGGVLVLIHNRLGPRLQGVSLVGVVAALVVDLGLFFWFPRRGIDSDLILIGLVVFCVWVLVWACVVMKSLRMARSMFRLVDSPKDSTCEDLARLGPGVQFRELSFAANPTIAYEVGPLLARQRKLVRLNLSRTAVTDEQIKHLAWLPELQQLNLGNTKVTDAVFAALLESHSLIDLCVDGADCTPAAARAFEEELRKRHPWPATVRVSLGPTGVGEELVAPSDVATQPQGPPTTDDADLNRFLTGIAVESPKRAGDSDNPYVSPGAK